MSSLREIRPTKGYLLELKQRVVFIEKGYQLLKLKRDSLANELKNTIESLRGKRKQLLIELEAIYKDISAANIVLGPIDVKSYALSVQNHLEIDILPKSIMGVHYPYIRIISKPQLDEDIDILLKKIIEDISVVFYQILQLAEIEAKVERIADEFGKTNRKVNVLRDIIIPDYHEQIKSISEKLDAESLEELVRLKTSRGVLEDKKS